LKAIELLVERKIINTPKYWLKNAKKGKRVKGEYAAILIKRIVNKI